MNRFDQDGLFDRLAGARPLDLALMAPLATAIAQFHLARERRPDHGGAAGMAWVVDGNAAGSRSRAQASSIAALCGRADTTTRALPSIATPRLLDRRREAGFVRQCHGDLHLRNIVLLDGRPTLFDAIEFNDEIACIDVLYDLAFLLMDLWRRRLPRHANVVWNGYLARDAGLRWPAAAAAVPVVPGGGAREDERHGGRAAERSAARRGELEEIARGLSRAGRALLRSGRRVPDRHRRLLGVRQVDARACARAVDRAGAWRLGCAKRRDPQAAVRRRPAHASRLQRATRLR